MKNCEFLSTFSIDMQNEHSKITATGLTDARCDYLQPCMLAALSHLTHCICELLPSKIIVRQ